MAGTGEVVRRLPRSRLLTHGQRSRTTRRMEALFSLPLTSDGFASMLLGIVAATALIAATSLRKGD